MSDTLTPPQREMLELFAAHDARFSTTALQFHLGHDRTMQSLHVTAASLVRRGLARRHKIVGQVSYAITDAGKAWITEHERVWVVTCPTYTTQPSTKARAEGLCAELNDPGSQFTCREHHEVKRLTADQQNVAEARA